MELIVGILLICVGIFGASMQIETGACVELKDGRRGEMIKDEGYKDLILVDGHPMQVKGSEYEVCPEETEKE